MLVFDELNCLSGSSMIYLMVIEYKQPSNFLRTLHHKFVVNTRTYSLFKEVKILLKFNKYILLYNIE